MVMSLDIAVTSVAVLIDDADQFSARAASVAQELGPAAIAELATRFHSPPRAEPPGFGIEQRGLSGWLSAWQFAIFELFFHFGPAALPVLRRVAFGEYDWTQGNAIEVLVRLAAVGVERGRILDELRRVVPVIRFYVQLFLVGARGVHVGRGT